MSQGDFPHTKPRREHTSTMQVRKAKEMEDKESTMKVTMAISSPMIPPPWVEPTHSDVAISAHTVSPSWVGIFHTCLLTTEHPHAVGERNPYGPGPGDKADRSGK